MNFNFQKELENSKKMMKNPQKQIVYAKRNLNILHNYIIKLKKYFEGDNINIRDVIYDEFEEELEEYTKVSGTNLIQRQENILQILSVNPHLVDKIYNKIKDDDISNINLDDEEYKVNGNDEECAEFEIKLILQKIRSEKIDENMKLFLEKILNPKDKDEKIRYKRQLSEDPKLREAIEYTKIYMADDEREKINRFIEYRKKELNREILDLEKNCLKLAGKFLKKFDLLNELVEQQNSDYQELSMTNMQYKLKTDKKDNDIGVEDIFTDEYINTLDIEKLSVLNAFWQNRFTKVVDNVKQAIFIADSLDIWDKLEDENYEEKLDNEQILKIILKMNVCDNISKRIGEQITEIYKTENYRYSVINMKDINRYSKEEYINYFDEILPECENDFDIDLLSGQSSRNNINIIYEVKDNMIKELLLQIDYNSKIKNWGYMVEEQGNKKKILLGIDYPGFNMPLRLHVDKKDIIEYFKVIRNSAVIPIYEGCNDMSYKGRMLTTKVLMPLTETRESEIINKNKTLNSVDVKYSYIKHLGNLVTKKCKKISQIYPHKYIDLESGKTGVKMNGKFIPDEEQENQDDRVK